MAGFDGYDVRGWWLLLLLLLLGIVGFGFVLGDGDGDGADGVLGFARRQRWGGAFNFDEVEEAHSGRRFGVGG